MAACAHSALQVTKLARISLFKTCLLAQCRSISTTIHLYKGQRVNVQRPILRHNERRILDALTIPVVPKDVRPLPNQCYDKMQQAEENDKSELMEAYFAFKLKEAKKLFLSHEMIITCHKLPTLYRDYLKLRIKVAKAGFKLVPVNNFRARQALGDTHMRNLIPFFRSDTALIIREEPDLDGLVKLLKKTPELLLLGGLVQNTILSKDGILEAAKLPPIDHLRGELLTVLSTSASKISGNLSQHQQELSTNLTQLVAQGEKDTDTDIAKMEKTAETTNES